MKKVMECLVKQVSMSKSLQTKNKFCAILKEAASKIETQKDFGKLDGVIGSKKIASVLTTRTTFHV